nr:translation initiation factor IF-2-like [Ovis aries]
MRNITNHEGNESQNTGRYHLTPVRTAITKSKRGTLGSSACRTAINHGDSPFVPRPASPPGEWVARRRAHLTGRLHPRGSNSIHVPAAVRRPRAHPEPPRLQPRCPTTLRAEAPGGIPLGKTTLAQSRRPYSLVPPSPCVPTTPQPPDCQAPQVSSGGEERPGGGVSAAAAPYLAQALPAGLGEGGDLSPADRRRADFPRPGGAVGGGRGGRRGKGFVSASRPPSAPARVIPLPQPPSRTLERWGGGAEGARKAPARPGSTPALPPPPPRTAHPAPRDAQPLRSPRQPAPRRQGGELRQKVDLTRREPRWPGSRPASAPPPRFARSPGEGQAVVPEDKAQRPLSICSCPRLHERVHPPPRNEPHRPATDPDPPRRLGALVPEARVGRGALSPL